MTDDEDVASDTDVHLQDDGHTDTGHADTGEAPAKPSFLTRSEAVYGYVMAAELAAVAAINLADTHGKGAPKHPETVLAAGGLVAAVALVATVLVFRNRFVAGMAAIMCAFVVTLPKVPDSATVFHLFGLVFPLVYALILTQRQRKGMKVQLAAGGPRARNRSAGARNRAAGSGTGPRSRQPAGRSAPSASTRRGRRNAKAVQATGPVANRRYTPPKRRPGAPR